MMDHDGQRGVVVTFTLNHQAWGILEPPYVIAVVELAEQPGLRLTTNLVGVSPGDVRSGMPVQVHFEHLDDVYLPLFEPAT